MDDLYSCDGRYHSLLCFQCNEWLVPAFWYLLALFSGLLSLVSFLGINAFTLAYCLFSFFLRIQVSLLLPLPLLTTSTSSLLLLSSICFFLAAYLQGLACFLTSAVASWPECSFGASSALLSCYCTYQLIWVIVRQFLNIGSQLAYNSI